MKHTYHIKTRSALWAMLGVAGLVSVPPMAYGQSHCQSYWTAAYKCSQGCGSCGGGGNNAPSRDYEAERRAQEAAEANAAAERQRQAEADRIERERQAEIKRQKEAAFIRDRDAAANSLKGSSDSAMGQLKGLSGTDNSGLKGSGFDTDNSGLKGSGIEAGSAPTSTDRKARLKPAPHTDTSVVDARNVPSDLLKGLDNAIASAYSDAPPGVSDRVRKGFQAVMERDWKVAKAWFQDALNRDPNNAGLKRLVALADAPQQANQQPATVDAKGANVPPTNPNLQLPDPNDIRFLFPGLQAMKDREAPVYRTLPDGRRVQMPQDSDMEFLFPGEPLAPARKPTPTFIIGKNGQLIPVPENSDQKSSTYIKGKDGKLIEVPQPADALFLFPGNSPAATPKPAGESGKTK